MNSAAPKTKTSPVLIVIAAIVGTLVAVVSGICVLAVVGARSYLAAAKASEARNSVSAIAMNIVQASERESADGFNESRARAIKLTSLPPVPTSVPRGDKYMSSPSDWAAWSPIRFELRDPQRYQYEVVAAADGQSAEVIARGDLNGDGKTSLFSYKLHVQNGLVAIAPTIDETDPEE